MSFVHIDLKAASCHSKTVENFANYFLKTLVKRNCFIVLKCICLRLQQSMCKGKSHEALRHLRSQSVLKINETFYSSMNLFWNLHFPSHYFCHSLFSCLFVFSFFPFYKLNSISFSFIIFFFFLHYLFQSHFSIQLFRKWNGFLLKINYQF